MKKIASGHIAFWEGGSLWVFDVPVAAESPSRNAMHAHHAFQLTFSLGGAFSLHLDDRALAGRACGIVTFVTIFDRISLALRGRAAASLSRSRWFAH